MIYGIPIKLTLFVTAFLVLAGCGEDSRKKEYRPSVVTTSEIISSAVNDIGGEFILLHKISGKNTTHSSLPPSEKEIEKTVNADLIIFNGLYKEERIAKKLQSRLISKWKLNHISLSNALDVDNFVGKNKNFNPNFWLDPLLWSKSISFITDSLVAISPDNERIYRRNEEQLLIKLNTLNDYISEQVLKIPEDKRVIVTARDSFEYFTKRYGFINIYFESSAGSESIAASEMERVADLIKVAGVKTIFLEYSFTPRNMEILQHYLKTQGYEIKIGGVLYSQTTDDKNYVEMMTHNIDTIVKLLMDNSI